MVSRVVSGLLGKLNGIILVKLGQNIFHSSCVAHSKCFHVNGNTLGGLEEVATGNSTVDSNECSGVLADLFSYQCNLTSHGLYTRIQCPS